MKTFRQLFLVLGLCGIFAGAQAQDLYAAEERVADDSISERNAALSRALRQVMVRLSGSVEVTGSPAAQQLLGRAATLVQQFRYRLDEAQAPDPQTGEPMPPVRFLWAKFDKGALDRAMRAAGLPLWIGSRPRVLMWIAYQEGTARSLLNTEFDPRARDELLARASDRGMPLQLPLMDLQDQAALNAADVWADYQQGLEAASARYPHDVIISGRLQPLSTDRWQARWTLWDQGQQMSWESVESGWYPALLSGLDGGQDRLAARYAPAAGGDGPERLRVMFTQVESLSAYGRLLQLLQQEGIDAMQLRAVQQDQVIADVWVRGGRSALTRMFALGGELFEQPPSQPVALPVLGSVDANPLAEAAAEPASTMPAVDLIFSYLQPKS